jgi:hypothetical protein
MKRFKKILSRYYNSIWYSLTWVLYGCWFGYYDIKDGVTWGIGLWITIILLHGVDVVRKLSVKLHPVPEIVEESMPVLATRYAGVRLVHGTMWFKPVIPGHPVFGIDADAECRYYDHQAPEWNCSCGFYAVPADKLPRHYYGHSTSLILLVELSGEVIIHNGGYRAEHQRILEVYVGKCHKCGCQATALLLASNGKLDAVSCDDHVKENEGSRRQVVTLEEASDLAGVPFKARYGNTGC